MKPLFSKQEAKNTKRKEITKFISCHSKLTKQQSQLKWRKTLLNAFILKTLIFKLTFSSTVEGNYCGFISEQFHDRKIFEGVQNDPEAISYPNDACTNNQFRIALFFRPYSKPPEGTSALIAAYSDKIKIYLETLPNGDCELAVSKTDEPQFQNLFNFKLGALPRWVFLWLEVSSGKSEVAFKDGIFIDDDDLSLSFLNHGKLSTHFICSSSSSQCEYY